MTEEELLIGYMEEVEHELQNEGQLLERQHRGQLVINSMIEERVIAVQRQPSDRRRPELRVLTKASQAVRVPYPRRK